MLHLRMCFIKNLKQFSNFEYHPVDKFTEGYTYAEDTKNMDITEIQYPDNYFDFILCTHVLEHISEDRKAMRELFRVLKPGGFGILQVPIDLRLNTTYEDASITAPQERIAAFGQFDHVRIYGKDYKDRLTESGFNVDVNKFVKELSEENQKRLGLPVEKALYLVYK